MQEPVSAVAVEEQDAPAFGPVKWSLWTFIALILIGLLLLYMIQGVIGAVVFIAFLASRPGLATDPTFLAKLRSQDPSILNQVFSAGALTLAVSAAEVAMALAGFALARAFFSAGSRQLGLGSKLSSMHVIRGLAVGIALWGISAIIGVVQANLFGQHPQLVEKIFELHRDALSIGYDFVGACVIAPICEEFFFRGIIFAGLVQRMPLAWAAVLSGIIFSAAHVDRWSFIPLAVIGVGLAYLYYRTKSLWPNIVAHFTVNTTSLILIHVFPQLAK